MKKLLICSLLIFSALISAVPSESVSAATIPSGGILSEYEPLIQSKIGHWNVYKESGFNVSIQSDFTPNMTIPSNPPYGLTAGKKVKQAWVRLTEGDYDSGKGYSAVAPSNSSSLYSTPKLSKINNPLYTSYTSWDWLYF